MKIEGGFGGRAWWGGERFPTIAVVVVVVTTASGFGGGLGCSYDYNSLMGSNSPDGGSDSAGSAGTPGSGGRSATGSGGTGAEPGGTGGAGSGGGAATGGAPGTGGGEATGGVGPGTGGDGTAGLSGTGGGATGGGPTGGASAGTGGSGTGGTAGAGASGGAAGATTGGGGATAGGGAGGGQAADPDLVLWYRFDESSGDNGTTVPDSATATGTPHPGMLATFGTGGEAALSMLHQVGNRSVSLTANGSTGGGYVALPPLQDLAPDAITVALWVQVTTAQRWQRVFDVGTSTATNMALTTQDATDSVRFVIRVAGGPGEQIINTTAKLTLSVWHHLAVVLRAGAPYTGEIFVDGVSAGSNTAMTLHPGDLGTTLNNFLGRSQFDVDPYWSGLLDDFRVYRRALTAAEVTALMLQR